MASFSTIYKRFKTANERWGLAETWKTEQEKIDLKAYKYIKLMLSMDNMHVTYRVFAKAGLQCSAAPNTY